jgi:hypothetical protein
MSAQQKFENVEEMFKEAEDTFRKGVGTLNTWNEQARDIIENKPGIILAAVGVSGFITGALLRHGIKMRKSVRAGEPVQANTLPGFQNQGLPADPIVLFVAGIVAGIVAGPKVIQEAISGIHRAAQGDTITNLDSARVHGVASAPMNEKPFEKY